MSDLMLEKANRAIEVFLDTDPKETDPKVFGQVYQQANVAMRVRHDAMVGARIEIDQKLRAIGIAFSDPSTRERYMRATTPQLLPELKARPEKTE